MSFAFTRVASLVFAASTTSTVKSAFRLITSYSVSSVWFIWNRYSPEFSITYLILSNTFSLRALLGQTARFSAATRIIWCSSSTHSRFLSKSITEAKSCMISVDSSSVQSIAHSRWPSHALLG